MDKNVILVLAASLEIVAVPSIRNLIEFCYQCYFCKQLYTKNYLELSTFFIRKDFIRKGGSNRQNLKKIVRKSEAQFPKLSVFIGQKSVCRRYCIQHLKDGIQIQVYNSINESVNHSSQFISVKVKKNLRRSQAQFREMLRKLRLRQNNDFLIKRTCI